MSDKWTIEVKEHPCIKDGTYEYDTMEDMERFVGNGDIQVDHIKSVIHHNSFTERAEKYSCVDLVPVSATRLLLTRMEDPEA